MFKEIFEELKVKLLEGLKKAGKAFIDTLWEFLKDDVILSARKSLGIIDSYLHSTDGLNKKNAVIELIMLKIKLPLALKPFKFVIKKMVQDKIDEVIKELFEKGNELLNGGLKILG